MYNSKWRAIKFVKPKGVSCENFSHFSMFPFLFFAFGNAFFPAFVPYLEWLLSEYATAIDLHRLVI